MRPTWADINLAAIEHNIHEMQKLVSPKLFCAVVKADAYGHGAIPVARAAVDAGADWLAVALVEEGKAVTKKLMSLQSPPDAICSCSDFSALGAMKWLTENNYKVPEEVGIVGFGNDPFTQYLEPTMTSVDQKSKDMGKTAAQVFLEQLEGKNSIARKVLLNPELVTRASSQKLSIGKSEV